ncbi:MAG: CAP domain-containing protein [Cyanosarcina radialis HA8281-LM2]|nr:CAP domain-containing protein [Cyanosarcina radialis HA8281-LM2]
MNKIFLSGIAFGSVLLTTGSLSVPAQAQNSTADIEVSTTPIYLAQSTNISTASLEQKVLAQINQYRNRRGLRSLTANATITRQARLHSQNMAAGRVPFGHQGFQQRLSAIARVIPLMAMSENVAYNFGYSDPATVAVKGWLNSPGHRLNIQGNYNLTGIGVAKSPTGAYYFTQLFVRNR